MIELCALVCIVLEFQVPQNVGNTGYNQKNGAATKVNKKFISHLTRAQRTPSAAATVQVSHALITILQCVHPGSHEPHPHGN